MAFLVSRPQKAPWIEDYSAEVTLLSQKLTSEEGEDAGLLGQEPVQKAQRSMQAEGSLG